MAILHKIITGLIIALGALHCCFTAFNYRSFSLDAMWFLSAGIALILSGILNLVVIRERARDRLVWALCVMVNGIFAVMFAFALLMLTQPQVFVGVALFVTVTVCSIFAKNRNDSTA